MSEDVKSQWRPPSLPETVELHGLRHACAPRSPIIRRVLWWLVIIILGLMITYLLVDRLIFYMSYPTMVSTSLIYHHSVPFPRVTICNWNRAQASVLRSDNGDPTQASFADIFPAALVADANINWTTQYITYSQPIGDALLSCKFNGNPCSASDFEQVFTPDGICHSFNSNGNFTSSWSGSTRGLQLDLNVQTDEYVTPTEGIGFKVHITESGAAITSEGVTVNPGRATRLEIKRSEISSLAPPYGSCHGGRYGNGCILACFAAKVLDVCHCRSAFLPSESTTGSVCNPQQEEGCVKMVMDGDCPGACPQPCNEVVYEYTKDDTTISQISLARVANITSGTTVQYLEDNLVKLSVFYGRLSTQVTESYVAYSMAELLADIALYLVILLGCSLVTLIELIDYGIWHCIFRIRKE